MRKLIFAIFILTTVRVSGQTLSGPTALGRQDQFLKTLKGFIPALVFDTTAAKADGYFPENATNGTREGMLIRYATDFKLYELIKDGTSYYWRALGGSVDPSQFIQNQFASAETGKSFWVSGNGRVGLKLIGDGGLQSGPSWNINPTGGDDLNFIYAPGSRTPLTLADNGAVGVNNPNPIYGLDVDVAPSGSATNVRFQNMFLSSNRAAYTDSIAMLNPFGLLKFSRTDSLMRRAGWGLYQKNDTIKGPRLARFDSTLTFQNVDPLSTGATRLTLQHPNAPNPISMAAFSDVLNITRQFYAGVDSTWELTTRYAGLDAHKGEAYIKQKAGFTTIYSRKNVSTNFTRNAEISVNALNETAVILKAALKESTVNPGYPRFVTTVRVDSSGMNVLITGDSSIFKVTKPGISAAGTVAIGGSLAFRTVTYTTTVTLTDSITVALFNNASSATCNLPALASAFQDGKGRVYIIKKIGGAGAVTITPNGGETIEGASSKSLSTTWDGVVLQATATGWIIMNSPPI